MCGRFGLTKTLEQIKARYGAQGEFAFEPNFNVCPTHIMPVIVDIEQRREIRMMKWGMQPAWSKQLIINARGETVATKPSFRNAFASRRCIVPASGFFEWKRPEKTPYWFTTNDGLFAFCGLWNNADGVENLLILTTTANDVVGPVHDRMPVAVTDNAIGPWLAAGTPQDTLEGFLAPFATNQMAATQVSPYVNSVKNTGKACIAPINSK